MSTASPKFARGPRGPDRAARISDTLVPRRGEAARKEPRDVASRDGGPRGCGPQVGRGACAALEEGRRGVADGDVGGLPRPRADRGQGAARARRAGRRGRLDHRQQLPRVVLRRRWRDLRGRRPRRDLHDQLPRAVPVHRRPLRRARRRRGGRRAAREVPAGARAAPEAPQHRGHARTGGGGGRPLVGRVPRARQGTSPTRRWRRGSRRSAWGTPRRSSTPRARPATPRP